MTWARVLVAWTVEGRVGWGCARGGVQVWSGRGVGRCVHVFVCVCV